MTWRESQPSKPATLDHELLTVAEAARRTRLSERQIRRMLADGRLSAVRFRGLRLVRIREADLLGLMGR